jgi:hypothetical protein
VKEYDDLSSEEETDSLYMSDGKKKYAISMSFHEGGYEDCPHCNPSSKKKNKGEDDDNTSHSFDSDFSVPMKETDGPCTIPGHPLMYSYTRNIITEENKDTIEQTPEICEATVEDWGPSITYVRDEFITHDLCKKAIYGHGSAISCIKRELLTPEEYYSLCMQSVTENGFNMKFIPVDVQTQELCDAAIESSCWALPHCKEEFKTRANCLKAVSGNGQTIQHVPHQYIDEELCIAAAKSEFECINYFPTEYITPSICKVAVQGCGENLRYIPDDLKTSEICLIAVQSPGMHLPQMSAYNINHIPIQLITKEIIVEVMKRAPYLYDKIASELITEDIEVAILEANPTAIQCVKKTPANCLYAIKKDIKSLRFLRKSEITKEMAEYILAYPEIDEIIDFSVIEHLKTLIASD